MKINSYKKGFTLVELLVVIAIIAILVLIVVIVIDPVARLKDSQNARANADVRSTASAVAACITKEEDPYTNTTCASEDFLKSENYLLNKPANVVLSVNSSSDVVCIYAEGEGGKYASWQSKTSTLIAAPYGVDTCT